MEFHVLKFQGLNVRESEKVAQVAAVKCLGHEPRAPVMRATHSKFFYERHQTQLVQLGQWPQLAVSDAGSSPPESDGVVEVWECSKIQGVASQRTRLERIEVVDKMGDDHFPDFIREATGRVVRGTRLWGRTAEEIIDLNFALIPNDLHGDREVCPYGANRADVSTVGIDWFVIIIPDVGGIEPFERPTPLVVGDVAMIVAGGRDASSEVIGSDRIVPTWTPRFKIGWNPASDSERGRSRGGSCRGTFKAHPNTQGECSGRRLIDSDKPRSAWFLFPRVHSRRQPPPWKPPRFTRVIMN